LTVLVAVVEDRVLAQALHQLGWHRYARIEGVVVVVWHLEDRRAALTQCPRGRECVVSGECHELGARHPRRPVATPQRGRAQSDADATAGIARRPAADETEGSGDLRGLSGHEAE